MWSRQDTVREHWATSVIEQKELVHPALVEPDTAHQERPWRETGYFIDEQCHPREQEANVQKPELPAGV